jgi:NADP-dependent 3-hydroxy acid dehydrogenase YdfG
VTVVATESQLRSKTALVTGAGRGIGTAIAVALAQAGAKVILVARTSRDIEEVASRIRSRGGEAAAAAGDVSADDVMEGIVGAHGPVDILVNNAGMGIFKPFAEMTVCEFDQMWKVNMRGVFLATKAVLPGMRAKKEGDIVTISSLAGKNGFKGGTGYGATKWAVRGFASSLMLEVRDENIRVVTIFPGSVDTGFSKGGKRGPEIPQPDDVASGVLFAVTAPRRAMFSEIDVRPTKV